MGFRTNSFATVWSVEPKSDVNTNVRLSISRKNKQTGEYEQDFSGFVAFIGSANAQKAARLKERDRIKLGGVDVSTTYNADKKITRTNYKCFSFEPENTVATAMSNEPQPEVDDGMISDDRLPF